MSKCLLLK